ncbi:MAG: hypothetical protein ABIZ80_18515 [Bryobacteraceae bacterium]
MPFELTASSEYSVVVQSNAGITQPDTVFTAPVSPGVAALSDRRIIAQHLDFTLITPDSPAKPGEVITDPPVSSSSVAPSGPLASAVTPPVVTVHGQTAALSFAGLTPGGVGLYQINFAVPQTIRDGDLPVSISQCGVAANATALPVRR